MDYYSIMVKLCIKNKTRQKCMCVTVYMPWGGSESEYICLYVEHCRSPKPVDTKRSHQSPHYNGLTTLFP